MDFNKENLEKLSEKMNKTLDSLNKHSKNVIILDKKVERVSDGRVFTCIIPDPELGYYHSLLAMEKDGYVNAMSLYIENDLTMLNPTRFRVIS